MTIRPTRATTDGRIYLDLQNLARRTSRPTDELHQLYALEGFLARLAESPHAANLVLKGGVLLAAYGTRRPTRDVDLQGRRLQNDTEHVLHIMREVAARSSTTGCSSTPTRLRRRPSATGMTTRACESLSPAGSPPPD